MPTSPHATMPLIATNPLLVDAGLRPLAEYALTVLSRCRFVTKASFMAAMGPLGLRSELLGDWISAGLVFEASVKLDPLGADAPLYLALTRQGAKTLAASSGHHIEAKTAADLRRPSQKRAHDVHVGELALAVLSLANDGLIDLIGVETDDKRLAFSTVVSEPDEAPEQVTLRPDAYLVANSPMGSVGYLVEVDRGTIQPKTMARRYRAYLAWQKAGGPAKDFGVKALRILTAASSEARMRALHDAALEAHHERPSGFLLFALQEHLTVCTAEWWLGPVAYALGTAPAQRVALLPETDRASQTAAA